MGLTHLNPAALPHHPAFSQGVLIEEGSLLVVGGQNGVDSAGSFVSERLEDQTRQAFRNMLAVLAEAGADQSHVAQLTIHLVAGEDPRAGFEAAAEVWGSSPAAVTVLLIAGLARPEALVEVTALAVVPPR